LGRKNADLPPLSPPYKGGEPEGIKRDPIYMSNIRKGTEV